MNLVVYELINGQTPNFIQDGGYWPFEDTFVGFSNKSSKNQINDLSSLLIRNIKIHQKYSFVDINENELSYNQVINMTYKWWLKYVSQLSLSDLKKERIKELAFIRWQKEISGIEWTDSNGNTYKIPTDRESRNSWVSVHESIVTGVRKDTDTIKIPGVGVIVMDNQNAKDMTEKVSRYIQDCFNTENTHDSNILSKENESDVLNYDLLSNWP